VGVDNNVIYVLWTPNTFVTVNKSQYFYALKKISPRGGPQLSPDSQRGPLHRKATNPWFKRVRARPVCIVTGYWMDGPEIVSGGGEFFRTRPNRPWGPPSLLYNGYRVTLPGVKRPGRGVYHPPNLAPRLKKE